MNKDKLVELGLSEEQAQQVLDGFGKMIPIERLNEKIEEVKTLQTTVTERENQIKSLEPMAAGNEALVNQIKSLQEANEATKTEYENQLKDTKLNTALKLALNGKVQDLDIVTNLLDRSKFELDDSGNIVNGLEDQVTALKESKGFLFVPEKVEEVATPATPSFTPGSPTPPANGSTDPFAAKMAKYE